MKNDKHSQLTFRGNHVFKICSISAVFNLTHACLISRSHIHLTASTYACATGSASCTGCPASRGRSRRRKAPSMCAPKRNVSTRSACPSRRCSAEWRATRWRWWRWWRLLLEMLVDLLLSRLFLFVAVWILCAAYYSPHVRCFHLKLLLCTLERIRALIGAPLSAHAPKSRRSDCPVITYCIYL